MITISVRHDFKELERWLTGIEKKQLPFATATALNQTKKRLQGELATVMIRELDRPTPFTMSAFDDSSSTWAKKTNLMAWVRFKKIQAQYLYPQVYGGNETDIHLVPGKKATLNQYGNLPKNASRGRGVFTMPGKKDTLYKRRGKEIIRLGHWSKSRSYRKRLPFEQIIESKFGPIFGMEFGTAFSLAMLTAR